MSTSLLYPPKTPKHQLFAWDVKALHTLLRTNVKFECQSTVLMVNIAEKVNHICEVK